MAGADHLIYDRDFSDAFLVSFLQTTSNGYINEYMQGFNALAQSFVSCVVGGMITSEIYGGEFAANFAHGFIGSYIDYTQNALGGILDTDFTLIEALELTMDFVPVVSNLKAAYEFSTGKTIFGNVKLEPLERNLAAASIFLGPVAKAAVKTTKVAVTVARHSDEAADLLTASSKVHDATKATDAALNVTKSGFDDNKFKYIFGKVTSSKHSKDRSNQLALTMENLGVGNNATGQKLLKDHFHSVVQGNKNVIDTFTNKHGTFEVRESLFFGPSGKSVKFQSTFEVLQDGTRQFNTVIPKGSAANY
ncbi:pre-toxin TG domain-containing protein [Vibrio neptunius]|uniref:pre-toxin TG domain-containing protein n=1 Tax=Vibrio neptunius TaxID=170651 RepID=UPI0019CFF701|nr:pre-toxin TG domain-containing protein [Vibrio neptunius]MBN3575902.1 hypothetical protein [Vibrio neptunius]